MFLSKVKNFTNKLLICDTTKLLTETIKKNGLKIGQEIIGAAKTERGL